MRVIRFKKFGDASGFSMQTIDTPEPKEGEVRIRISASGFNPIDWKIREGQFGGSPNQILGFDCSGVIDAIGPNETRFKVGDEVYALAMKSSNGTYAEYSCIPTQLVAKKPKNVSFEEAAAIPLAAMTAYRAIIDSSAFKKNDTAFVCGIGGGVGLFAVQFLRNVGVKEIYTIAKDQKSKDFLVKELGLSEDHILLYEGLSHDALKEKLLSMNGDRFFDSTLDLVGGSVKKLCLELTGYSGHFSSTLSEEDFSFPIWQANSIPRSRNMSIHQVLIMAELADTTKKSWTIYQKHLELITQMIEDDALRLTKLQTVGPFSVETVQKAHQLLESKRVKGKLVMTIL